MKKITFISLACAGLTTLSVCADTLTTQLAQCAQVQDSLARLVCYDDLVKTASLPSVSKKQTVIVSKESKKPSVPSSSSVLSKEASFGAEHLKKKDVSKDADEVIFVIRKLTKSPHGQWRITFDNGQEWKQTDGAYFKVAEGQSVMLKKGALGAVYMKKNEPNSNKKIRVKRVK